jgi:hypothetical protein
MLNEFGPVLYVAEGPAVSFYGFPYPTRMAAAVLSDGWIWIWSPVALTEELSHAVEKLGVVKHIVSPNKIHHLFLKEWKQRWPDAFLYASPGLTSKRPDLQFESELADDPHPAWANDIDQVVFRGSFAMEEVVFFHRPSRTAIFCDLVQRHPKAKMTGWRGALMRLDGLVGPRGSTPREWRATFFRRSQSRAARDKVLRWNAERLLIAHGDCSKTNASAIIADALSWI